MYIETLFASTVLEGNSEWIDQLQEWLPSQLQEKKMKLCNRASDNGGHQALSTTSAITKDPPLFWRKLESMLSVDMLLPHGEVSPNHPKS
jgi:hypothetical protein